jgi:hypothetical protein
MPETPAIEAFRAVFGKYPEDVIAPIQSGRQTICWLGALFDAIKRLHKTHNNSMDIKHLAALGQYVADDISVYLESEYMEYMESIHAAEQEGGAA